MTDKVTDKVDDEEAEEIERRRLIAVFTHHAFCMCDECFPYEEDE